MSTNKQHTLSVSRSPGGPVEKEEQKFGVHVAGSKNHGEKRNVLIVIVLLPIGVDLMLRNNTKLDVKVPCVREGAILMHVAA